MNKKFWTMALAVGLLGAGVALPLSAQQAGGGNNGGNNNGQPNWRNMSPEERKTARLNMIKEAMGASDEDWKALEPKVAKLQDLQMQNMMGRFGGGRRGGPQQDATSQPANPVRDAAAELQKVLDNKDATADQIKEKLTALHEVKAKATEELKKAQAELRELLTVRQEAVLVSQGLLE